jgi:hypothetical protein
MLNKPDVQTQKILELSEFFENLDPGNYNQKMFGFNGARCICGWINHRAGRIESDIEGACSDIGVSYETGRKLFRGSAGEHTSWFHTTNPTPKDAARALRHLAITGEVPKDW